MKEFFRQYFFLLDKSTKGFLPFLLVLFLLSSMLDVVGIGLISFFLLLVVNFNTIFNKLPFFLQNIFSSFSEKKTIIIVGILLIFSFIFKGVTSLYVQQKTIATTSQLAVRIKIRLMRAYQHADYAFHLKQNSSDLINRTGWADGFVNNAFSASLNFISSLLVMSGILFFLFLVHPIATAFLVVLVVMLFTTYRLLFQKKIQEMSRVLSIANVGIIKAILQGIGGLKEIRILGCESFFLQKLANATSSYSFALARYNALQLIPRYFIEAFASVFLIAIILVTVITGVKPVDIIPTLGVFAAACIRLLPTLNQFVGLSSQLTVGSFTTNLLYQEISTLENQRSNQVIGITKDRLLFSTLTLQDITFRYSLALHDALTDVNLTIQRGQSIGLIGPSGSGKSTLVSVILNLLKQKTGRVLVNGQPINDLRAWLNNFAYMPQSIFLLDDTLKHNIAMGIEDADIDEEKLTNAIISAQLSDVVSGLPQGADTVIGEHGIRLSGGQRQRVALARAFYFEREIIVMDEATSSLDSETEREVITAIKRLHGIKTLIVIAHRLTTIEYCDIVYKLEKGRITAQGNFNEVVKKSAMMAQ